jgi:hypothetical protein
MTDGATHRLGWRGSPPPTPRPHHLGTPPPLAGEGARRRERAANLRPAAQGAAQGGKEAAPAGPLYSRRDSASVVPPPRQDQALARTRPSKPTVTKHQSPAAATATPSSAGCRAPGHIWQSRAGLGPAATARRARIRARAVNVRAATRARSHRPDRSDS